MSLRERLQGQREQKQNADLSLPTLPSAPTTPNWKQLKAEKLHQKITASASGISLSRCKAKSYTVLETEAWNRKQQAQSTRKHKKRDQLDAGSSAVMHINERNLRFNRKVSRFFDKFTAEKAEAVERGTAL